MLINLIGLMAASVASASEPSPGAPAPNPATSTVVAAAPAATEDPNSKIVCRRVNVTGSRLGGSKVCQTVAQWAALSRDSKNLAEDIQRRGMTTRPPGN